MAKRLWSNYARCALGANITTTGTLATITLETGKGALFPSPTGGNWFILAVEDSSRNIEYFKITARSGDICTVGSSGADRAQEGSTARTFTAATSIAYLPVTKAFLDGVESHTHDEGVSHAASAVSVTPAGNLAATDVQAGLEELQGDVDTLDTDKADLASPALTGTPTAPTKSSYTGTTQIATTEFVDLVFPIGTPIPTFRSTPPGGFILAWGTIGNASSGASNRAAADTSRLFEFFWNNLADSQAPVSGGRGASGAADFAANKTIAIPDLRGRTLFGKDDMGGTAASRLTSGGSGVDGATLGVVGGNELVGAHTHGVTDPGHHHQDQGVSGNIIGGSPVVAFMFAGGTHNTSDATTGITVNSGGDGDAENIPPAVVCNWMFRL